MNWLLLLVVFCLGSQRADAEFRFDKGFDSNSPQVVFEDLNSLNAGFLTSQDVWFEKIFSGRTGQDVYHYLDERINYFIPSNIDITSRVSGALYFPPPAEVKDNEGNVIAALAAYNTGTDLFFLTMKNWNDSQVYFSFDGALAIKPLRTRIGIIELGPRFFERLNPADKKTKIKTSRLERISFLIHEAKHSDCEGGLSRDDFERVIYSKPILNRQCGHEHVVCPQGHKYAGAYACENTIWGPYAVESVFLQEYLKNCTGCSVQEKQEAAELLEDRKSRVLNWSDLMSGSLGEPNMSSGGPPWDP